MPDFIQLSLPDGSLHHVPQGISIADAIARIRPDLAPAALVAKLDDQVVDLSRPLMHDCALAILTFAAAEGREVFWHSATHLMAQAIKRLYPEAKLTVGPPLADGFYYDIDAPRPFKPDDLAAIEAEMAKIVAEDWATHRTEVSREEAKALFAARGEDYKLLLVDKIPADAAITLYSQGEFVDLCAGPHIPRTGRIKAFKLLSVAGAYWEGNQQGKQLQRIYGTAYEERDELEAHLFRAEEAKKRDHRKIGPEQELFMFQPDMAPGFAFWKAKGYRLYRTLENWSRELQEARGYQEVRTPWIYSSKIYEASGHWQHYRGDMFTLESEGQAFATKPMNCPGHCLIYKSEQRSYRDLPFKITEYGPISRYEASGALHGLIRVRGFHTDDGHLFVREDQIEAQIRDVIELVDEVYGALGLGGITIKLGTRPAGHLGDPAVWDLAEATLERCMQAIKRPYELNPGDGAFYGPKLDFHIVDALGRSWQCATLQLDFQLPIRFDLTYVDQGGQERRPVMIHRAIFGSLERFLGILIEHFAGAFPLWLAPVQVRILPIADRHAGYAASVQAQLQAAGIRAEVDDSSGKVGYKIRQAELAKIPFILVVGDKEAAAGSVAVRRRGMQDLGPLPLGEFVALAQQEIATKHHDESCQKAAAGVANHAPE